MLTYSQKRLAVVVGAIATATPPYNDKEQVAEEVYQAIKPKPGQTWDRAEALAVTFQWWDEIVALEERLTDLVCGALKAEDEAGLQGDTLIEDPSNYDEPDEEKGTPRWERASVDYCPRCASPVDLHIILKDGKEAINKERCTSCEWTA